MALVGVLSVGLSACAFPYDPEHTLEKVRSDALRVGVSENPPWTAWPDGAPVPGEESEPSGVEIDLLTGFAQTLDADVVWVAGSETDLMAQLDEGELDVVVAGLESTTAWSSHAAITTSYAATRDDAGAEIRHVMATRAGENDFLVALETYLLDQEVAP
ncbi:hypothetical protein SERN_2953 [Serinibacter arcticus]|uniref:Solute-binding protein family 3/N-terminal domain-containing protein n=1 Tax=Serinibacter arcticus TaxID=1655435 RepID=A0A4Z1E2S1_9MICO|nr:hypothetical protein SERN_2953 [Serinibacter arcticus]